MNRAAYIAGVVLQGLILGALLAIAIVVMLTLSSDATVFRYQGF